ncbi:MAG TPA: hypothetical protein VGF55_18710 [Gemmataceae bacterium]
MPFRPSAVLARTVVRRTGRTVSAGPFRGMKYVTARVGSAYCPKLLGVYEQELHPLIDAIVRLRPDRVINLGAAEGYYAVGLARTIPAAEVVAFEQTAEGQSLLRELAALNAVDRIRVFGRCEPADLQAELAPARRAVVVCDVEGYEATLLDPVAVPALAAAWVLVELHEFIVPGIGDLIRSRFAATHRITEIPQVDRTRADYPYQSWYTRLLPAAYAIYAVSEFRPARMSWLWLEPLAGGP